MKAWIISARKSFLDLLVDALGSTGVVPRYGDFQAKVEAMQADGVVVEACSACARKLELVEELEALGIDVKGMGVPLTGALKDPGTEVLTF